MSLDGYIAGPAGEYDWTVPDPDMDFAAMQAPFDTVGLVDRVEVSLIPVLLGGGIPMLPPPGTRAS